jgi:hypothetical protein
VPSKPSAAAGPSKLLRQLSRQFSKSFKDVRERLTKAMKGEEDGEIMVENAMHAIKSFKEMKDEGQKSVLVKIIASAKIARQYLSLESPSKDMYTFLENFKFVLKNRKGLIFPLKRINPVPNLVCH